MEKKNILIMIAIAIVLVVAGVILATNFQTADDIQYENLNLSDTCTVRVPICNNSTFTEDDGLKSYNATNLTIVTYNKNDLGEWENMGADIGLNGALNQNFKYNHSHHGNNILIHPDDNKTVYACLISNNTTGDVIVVMTSNEEVLYHIIDTVNFTMNNTKTADNATTDDAVETGENTAEMPDSASETTNEKTTDDSKNVEGHIPENDQDFDYDGDGVGDGSAYHSHEYYVEHGQSEPVTPAGN